jgi:hypothetical protein
MMAFLKSLRKWQTDHIDDSCAGSKSRNGRIASSICYTKNILINFIKSILALGAACLEWLFPAVQPIVLNQMVFVLECLLAMGTFIGALACNNKIN